MSAAGVVVVGDALLDRDIDGRVERLCPEAPVPVLDEGVRCSRPGGAALAAALAAADGRDVKLVTALADDAGGHELARLLARTGVEAIDVGLEGQTPTKTRFRAAGRLLLRLDSGTADGRVGSPPRRALGVIRAANAILVSDYGRGITAEAQIRAALAEATPRAPVVWDPHPLGATPVHGVRLATPNEREAARFVAGGNAKGVDAVAERACELRRHWHAAAIAITLGRDGALLVEDDRPPLLVPAPDVPDGDPCGAGDAFAAAVAGLLADGARLPDAVHAAVSHASAFVSAGGASAFSRRTAGTAPPAERTADVEEVVARVRAQGGTVVATGGCFDLLHAGHVSTLESARALGDCLIVCLNSDASVQRLKGAERPLVAEADRVAVLSALACVDGVVVFDEDTPKAVLERLRPDVFAKGGDYTLEDLPEARLVESWGGAVVVLPYVEGRSTTQLLQELALRGG